MLPAAGTTEAVVYEIKEEDPVPAADILESWDPMEVDQLEVEVLEPQTLGLVAFAAKDNQTTEELQRRINHSRKTWLTHAEIGGRRWIRVAVGAWRTEEHHMDMLYREIESALKNDA